MAEGIVHRLEAVEVDEQDRTRGPVAPRTHDRLRNAVLQQRAIRQPRQYVELRQVRETRLRGEALADVSRRAYDVAAISSLQRAADDLDVEQRAVLAPILRAHQPGAVRRPGPRGI